MQRSGSAKILAKERRFYIQMILRDFHTVWLRAVQKIEFLINLPNPISVGKIRFVFHRTIIQYRTKLTGFFVICLQPTFVCLTFENLNSQISKFRTKIFKFRSKIFKFRTKFSKISNPNFQKIRTKCSNFRFSNQGSA